MIRPGHYAELGSTAVPRPDLSIPWVLTGRPAYPLEDPMATSAKSTKQTATDGDAEQAATRATAADDAASTASNVTANDPAKDPETGRAVGDENGAVEPVEQDSHDDLVQRVRRLEKFLL